MGGVVLVGVGVVVVGGVVVVFVGLFACFVVGTAASGTEYSDVNCGVVVCAAVCGSVVVAFVVETGCAIDVAGVVVVAFVVELELSFCCCCCLDANALCKAEPNGFRGVGFKLVADFVGVVVVVLLFKGLILLLLLLLVVVLYMIGTVLFCKEDDWVSVEDSPL